mmetsp:Transcript_24896/g.41626  ORF Transcript_24896/g.41626 Transcript_24896/m.41626 type:complete len:254 (+) Transcript_24896:205-966(+)|eukprot:CAMPEP_0198200950 /NCGR_PEP_ID=MMETSP1445-20131203/3822_1 /TAXON_ID=36898 /ORGANISM="Pyramimonas sp., Strain CCMP2087" /LENGTH=253 /DNA_ID=CAMNT_0043871123 /DNA_START=100 /DNA_END=861 /DNA_ORIENTATION=-
MWRTPRLFACAASLSFASTSTVHVFSEAECRSTLPEEIAKLRAEESHFREKWIKDEEGWHKLPARAWPPTQPSNEEIPALRASSSACSSEVKMSEDCAKVALDLATALIFNSVDPNEGLERYRSLAKAGDLDGMVGTGVVLIGGHGVASDYVEGMQWIRKASEFGHAQGIYEHAVCFYTGDGEVEDEQLAFGLFRKAADLGHMGGMFMVGDCLTEGIGCKKDEADAVRWFFAAATQGHRQARGRILRYLDKEK